MYTKEARFELQAIESHHRVQKVFWELAAGPGGKRFKVVDVNREIEEIHAEILSIALGQLGARRELL